MNMGGLGQSCSFRARSSVCWSEAFYALTRLANSARKEKTSKWLMMHSIIKMIVMSGIIIQKAFTINSNLAITIGVSSLEESLGLGISECPRAGFEVLQEQSVERALLVLVLVLLLIITAKIELSINILQMNEPISLYFSSSSSMKPLLSWSMMAKAFLTSSADLPVRPTLVKKLLWLKEPSAV